MTPTVRRLSLALSLSLPALWTFGCGLTLTQIQTASDKPANVAVYFKVEDGKGEPVGGMTAEQFEIYEDDQLVSVLESQQTILNPEVAASHYTLLLIDMSGSVVDSEDAGKVTEAALLFTQEVEANNKVAIYAFDGEEEIHKISDFTGSAGGASARAGSLQSFAPKDKSTNLNGAIVQGLQVLDEGLEDAENPLKIGTMVVFTDGTDRAARVSKDEMLQAVRDTPYDVFAIGLGAELDEGELAAIGKDGTALAKDSSEIQKAFRDDRQADRAADQELLPAELLLAGAGGRAHGQDRRQAHARGQEERAEGLARDRVRRDRVRQGLRSQQEAQVRHHQGRHGR
ncbi:MAG: VWA domain-containing protein [Deltaproteobacteria bacterium]|nr:VWA domain-containing protein [Deltaproteobacteria bacterium]